MPSTSQRRSNEVNENYKHTWKIKAKNTSITHLWSLVVSNEVIQIQLLSLTSVEMSTLRGSLWADTYCDLRPVLTQLSQTWSTQLASVNTIFQFQWFPDTAQHQHLWLLTIPYILGLPIFWSFRPASRSTFSGDVECAIFRKIGRRLLNHSFCANDSSFFTVLQASPQNECGGSYYPTPPRTSTVLLLWQGRGGRKRKDGGKGKGVL